MSDAILDPLDEQQRNVALAPPGPLVVSAGAGTGKTTAITHRIAYRVREGTVDPRHVLAVTFTNRAAGEMRERLRNLGVAGVQARTFHAAALRQMRYFWPRFFGGEPFRLISSPSGLLVEATRSVGVRSNPAVIREILGEINWAKQHNTSPENYLDLVAQHGREVGLAPAEIATVYRAYEDTKVASGSIDFDDVLLLCAEILDGDKNIAAEVQDTYRSLTVDEFQDVSPIQFRLLQLWLGSHDDVCVVGDVAQTIYTFAGASDEFLKTFPTVYPTATARDLVRNYRSQPPIVDIANRVLAGSAVDVRSLVATREKTDACSPRVLDFADEVAEAQGIAALARDLIGRGTAPRDIAVLVRTKAQLPALEQSFADAGLPVLVRGGERFFDRSEVREAITRLRGAARSGEHMSGTLSEQVAAVLAVMGFTPEPPNGVGAVRQRWESLASLHALAADTDQISDLTALVGELDVRASVQHAPQADAVTLATIHAAKGLQWSIVVVAGLSEGTLPFSSWSSDAPALTDEDLAEEQRLFYVAITRARDDLVLTWAQARQPGARVRAPSRFLALALPDHTAGQTGLAGRRPQTTDRSRRRAPAACRTCATSLVTPAERARGRCRQCPTSADEALVERLKQWRLAQARERSVPAYVVLTDATVEALAEVKPASAAELGAISGIGPDKLLRYTDQLLALVADSDSDAASTLISEEKL
ncbi:MAG: ATP-dependent DNA helicase UvrD2 [Candidatus Nanopelagicales bacterium]